MTPKWQQNDTKMTIKWLPNDTKMTGMTVKWRKLKDNPRIADKTQNDGRMTLKWH